MLRMSLSEQKDLLAVIIQDLNTIIDLRAQGFSTQEALDECKLAYDRIANNITKLPWQNFGVKDFNRDIPWNELVMLNQIINNKSMRQELVQSIFASEDMIELRGRLQVIHAKQEKILEIEAARAKHSHEHPRENLLKFIYSDVEELRFDLRDKEVCGLPYLNPLMSFPQDQEALKRIMSAIPILECTDFNNSIGRAQTLAILLEIGEACKLLSSFAFNELGSNICSALTKLRDAIRHAPNCSHTQEILKQIVDPELSCFNAEFLYIKEIIIGELKTKLETLQQYLQQFSFDDLPDYRVNPLPSFEKEKAFIEEELGKLFAFIDKNFMGKCPSHIAAVKEILTDVLTGAFLVPHKRGQLKKDFVNKIVKDVCPFIQLAKQQVQIPEGCTKKEKKAIYKDALALPQELDKKIRSCLNNQPKFVCKDNSYIIPTQFSALINVLSPKKNRDAVNKQTESYVEEQLISIQRAIDGLQNVAIQAKVNLANGNYTEECEKIIADDTLRYAARFYLVVLADLILTLRNRVEFKVYLSSELIQAIELMRHVGNGIAHLQESDRGMLPMEAALFAINHIKPPLLKLLWQHQRPKVTESLLTNGIFTLKTKAPALVEDKENIPLSLIPPVEKKPVKTSEAEEHIEDKGNMPHNSLTN